MVTTQFQLAGGTVIGRDHYISKKNNQDGFHIESSGDIIVVLVTDGCGDSNSSHSEVGAKIGARLIAHSIMLQAKTSHYGLTTPEFWEHIRQNVLAQIRMLCITMGDKLSEIVGNYFLFTVVGALVTQWQSVFFSIGDGVIFVNDEKIQIGPFENNAPPYLGYALLEQSRTGFLPQSMTFQLHTIIETKNLSSFLVGCDGVLNLIEIANAKIPGKDVEVGSISDFWTNPRYFNNPYAISRKLAVINNQTKLIDWDKKKVQTHAGLLPDDTTFIVGTRNLIENQDGES